MSGIELGIGAYVLDGSVPIVDGVEHGLAVRPEGVVGWSGFESKTTLEDRPADHGSFEPTELDIASKAISLYLLAKAPTAPLLRRLFDEVAAAMVAEATVPAWLDDGLTYRARRLSVQRVSPPPTSHVTSAVLAIHGVAADPYWYGRPREASTGLGTPGAGIPWPVQWGSDWGAPGETNTLVVDNTEGTAPTFVDMRVSQGGLASGFQIVELETGRRQRYTQPVQQPWVIDLLPRIGRVKIDGSGDVTTSLTVREWAVVPAGESRTYAFESLGASSGAPILQAFWSPAHI